MEDEDEEFVGKSKKFSGEEEEDADDAIRERLRKQREAMQHQVDDEDGDEEAKRAAQRNRKKSTIESTSEPVLDDPYASDESSYIIPILVAIGAFIPLLFCLCKL